MIPSDLQVSATYKKGKEHSIRDFFFNLNLCISIETEHRCPSCGYEWSGKAK